MYKVTKEFNFDMAHMLDGHNGLCKNLHGHCYKVFVTLSSTSLDGMEMIMDFKDLKNICNILFDKFDHACAINLSSEDLFERELYKLLEKYNKKNVIFNFRLTAENMSRYFYERLKEMIEVKGVDVKVSKVIVYETPTSYAEYSE